MKKIKEWLENHLILAWAICTIIFALVVHCLFSIGAPNEWLRAKWLAGDLLTFVSTVALGLLAVWQNKKFKIENDNAQERLERLTAQANELAIISKIIEIEADNLSRLRSAFENFSTACNPQRITMAYADGVNSPNPEMTILTGMADAETHIDDSFFALCRELRTDPKIQKNDEDPLKAAIANYYYAAKKLVANTRANPHHNLWSELQTLNNARDSFLPEREKILNHKETLLNQVVYGNLTLHQIKELYHKEAFLPQQENIKLRTNDTCGGK